MATGNYAVGGGLSRQSSGATGTGVSEREDLANFISMITRDETPFMSSIGKTKATAIYHEWQTDALAAPRSSQLVDGADFDNVQPDGDDAADESGSTYTAPNRNRFGNYTQINGKTIAVSGTKRAVDQAGVADEYAYQLKKRGTELRRDVEFDLVGNNVASASTPRRFGGLMSWIQHPTGTAALGSPTGTVLYKNDTGASGQQSAAPATATNVGVGTNAVTVGVDVRRESLELVDVDQVMQAIYEAGGKVTKLMLSPQNRRVFSSKAQAADANVRRNIDEHGSLRQSVDMYMSDFGEIMVMPNYMMGLLPNAANTGIRNFAAFLYDPMWFNIATLRPMQEVDVGQRGDSTVGMIVEECTLEVRNPIGSGAIYGLNGT